MHQSFMCHQLSTADQLLHIYLSLNTGTDVFSSGFRSAPCNQKKFFEVIRIKNAHGAITWLLQDALAAAEKGGTG